MAGNDNTMAMDFLPRAADEVHRHFGPKRKRFIRSKLKAVFAYANIVCREGKLRPILLNLYRLENPRGVEFARAHNLDMSKLSYKG